MKGSAANEGCTDTGIGIKPEETTPLLMRKAPALPIFVD